jgi:hypothetical protein
MAAATRVERPRQRQAPSVLVLRKACQNCTRAKRRCTVQLPKCERCTSRGLACHYDLQPWVTSTADRQTGRAATHLIEHPHPAAPGSQTIEAGDDTHHGTLCWIELAKLPDYARRVVQIRMDPGLKLQHPTHPAMQVSVDGETKAYLVEQLKQMLQSANSGRSTPFIHPQARSGMVSTQIHRMLSENGDPTNGGKSFKDLIKTNVALEGLEGSLAAVQSLILYLSQALDVINQCHRVRTESLLTVLRKWLGILLVSAQDRMPRGLSPWRAWLLAESVRRTIITGFMLDCAYQIVSDGFCFHKLFVESLPFDSRPGLWLADSPQAWMAAARKSSPAQVGEDLTSFHDFSVNYKKGSGAMEDSFMRMILVAHYGKRRMVDSSSVGVIGEALSVA